MSTLNVIRKKNYAIVEMDQGKVNALNTDLWRDLGDTFRTLDSDDKIMGAILSGRPHCFSAGLDIMHIAQLSKEEYAEYWRIALTTLRDMIRFSKPLIGAITGYAPAGGTILALTTDYRIMGKGPKHVIGMHEFKMSLLIPELLCDIYAYHMGEKEAWVAVQKAQLYHSDDAVKVGLVNESVDVEDVLKKAEKHLEKQIGVYAPVFKMSKKYLRRELLNRVDIDVESHVQEFCKFGEDPMIAEMMKMFLSTLKK